MKTNALYDAVKSGEINADSEITVDVFDGPIGGYGFRSGKWNVQIGGIKFKFFCSIPHQCTLDEQSKMLKNSVRDSLQRTIEAETYVTQEGKTELRYAVNIERV